LSSRKGNDDEIIQRQRVRRERRRTAGRPEVQTCGHERSAGTRLARTQGCGKGFTRQAVGKGKGKESARALNVGARLLSAWPVAGLRLGASQKRAYIVRASRNACQHSTKPGAKSSGRAFTQSETTSVGKNSPHSISERASSKGPS